MRAQASGSVLVTGGTGFIGVNLVRALLDRGVRVSVIDDLSGGDPARLPAEVELIVADVSDPGVVGARGQAAALSRRARGRTGQRNPSMADPDRDRMVNLVGTAHVLEGARRGGAERFVFVSSGGAMTERRPASMSRLRRRRPAYYGVHKYAAERYVSLSPIPHAIARPSNVYGPGQRH